jgi:long-chain acyl-CoA synthetase
VTDTLARGALADIVRRHARERPDAPALTAGARTLTWAALDARSSRVAQALARAGVSAQDRIAFLEKNGPEYFEVLFGGAKLNAVNVAVNWRLAPGEIRYIVDDAEARVLVVGAEFLPQLEAIRHGLGSVDTVVVVGDAPPGHRAYEEWIACEAPGDPMAGCEDDDVAMQLYTSGTTGLPKGVMLSHANLGGLLPAVAPRWRFDTASVNAVAMPLFHIGGSGWALVGMWIGCHSILFREFVPAEILDAIPVHGITNALFVPVMLQLLSAVPDTGTRDVSTLRSIVYGASPITDEVLLRSITTFGCDFVQLYGLTETTGAITELSAADHDATGPRRALLRSAGKPFPWVELRVVDPASGDDCPRGVVGEVWARSVQTMKGYWKRPEDTARTITADGWLRTGDAGYLDAGGYVFLTDRVKDMIITGAENVYPAEVENVLASHPDVADVAVIGVPDTRWGETVKAIVVARPGSAPEPADIIAFARARLAHFKCPTSVDFADVLPRNPSGKLLKRQLREPYWKGRERRIA